MFLLYLDDSGDVDDPKIKHFVLGGVAIFERQTHWIGKELDSIAARFDPAEPASVELHGNPMLQGNKGWKAFEQRDRIQAIQDSLNAFRRTHSTNVVFAIVIEKGAVKDMDPVEHAFEVVLNRFDKYLQGMHRRGNTQRGLLVMDKSSYENRFQGLARNFRETGHRWGQLHNIAEVPLFVDSRATRLIQLADLVSYGIFRYFEKGDDRFYPIINSKVIDDFGAGTSLVRWLNPPSSAAHEVTITHTETHAIVQEDGTAQPVSVVQEEISIRNGAAPRRRRGRRTATE